VADIDPELRDKIIETHTLVKRMDDEHKEYKINTNARLKKLDNRADKHDQFRTKVLTYCSVVVIAGGVATQFVIEAFKKIG